MQNPSDEFVSVVGSFEDLRKTGWNTEQTDCRRWLWKNNKLTWWKKDCWAWPLACDLRFILPNLRLSVIIIIIIIIIAFLLLRKGIIGRGHDLRVYFTYSILQNYSSLKWWKTKYINTKPKNLKARHTNSSSGLFSKNIGRGKKVLGTRLHDIQIEASTHLTFPF